MKIVLLSGASSVHTIRWAKGLVSVGHEVHVITQHLPVEPFDERVVVHQYRYLGMLGYFFMVPRVRALIKKLSPDIVNAHYASGYATTARLVGCHPWVLSVWGSDVYTFPDKSPIHKWFVRKNLYAADKVASTSHCMAEQTRTIAPELYDIAITPFGVDLAAFSGIQPEPPQYKDLLVIGTVKTMKYTYGIDTLIEAYALLLKRINLKSGVETPELKLRLVGGGDHTYELQSLAVRLGVADSVQFVGQIPHEEVPCALSELDIYVALSRSESFGVAVLEAGAAGRPVVVSDVGGLPEVAIEGVTGFIVPSENPVSAADALEKLVLNAGLRNYMGASARCHVTRNYSWGACIDLMLRLYSETIEKFKVR